MTRVQATGGTSADQKVTDYKTSITNLGTTFSGVITALNTALGSVVDPKYGLVAGLNCAILG